MKFKFRYIWQTLIAIVYLAVVIGLVNIATTKFETVVFAALVQLYAAVLYNFCAIGKVMDTN
jgi:hypothetical protein